MFGKLRIREPWIPIFEHYGSYSIGTITMDPRNPKVLWLEQENNSQRSVGFGDGIYKSIDAGNTWVHMGLKTSEHIAKIIIDPQNSDNIYVASQGPLWRSGVKEDFIIQKMVGKRGREYYM